MHFETCKCFNAHLFVKICDVSLFSCLIFKRLQASLYFVEVQWLCIKFLDRLRMVSWLKLFNDLSLHLLPHIHQLSYTLVLIIDNHSRVGLDPLQLRIDLLHGNV